MLKVPLYAIFALFCFCFANPICLKAQDNARDNAQVTSAILHRDSLFWQAYNACDVEAMKAFFTPDLEFYHDRGGVTIGQDSMAAATRHGICGSDSVHVRREAVEGTIHVFPMRKAGVVYGAILSGDHRFYVKQPGKHEYLDGQAKFTHLWVLKDGEWKMSRVLSYDHGPAQYINQRKEIAVSDGAMHAFTGTYKGPNSGLAEVTVENGHLLLTIGKGKFALYPETESRWFMRERDLTFTFVGNGPAPAKPDKPAQSAKPAKLVVRENGDIAEELLRQ
jgi:hypothetical protein